MNRSMSGPKPTNDNTQAPWTTSDGTSNRTTRPSSSSDATTTTSIIDNNSTSTDVLESLRRLSKSLDDLALKASSKQPQKPHTEDGETNDTTPQQQHEVSSNRHHPPTTTSLKHYRQIPSSIQVAYQWLEQGGQLIEATSTKYTLLSQIDLQMAQSSMSTELLQGCQFVTTAAHVIAQHCSLSATRYCLQASRGIVLSVINLVEEITSPPTSSHDPPTPATTTTTTKKKNPIAAQKTGIVWEACQKVLSSSASSLPRGNRNSMRRELFTHVQECNETLAEFQVLLDAGPIATNDDRTKSQENDNAVNDNDDDDNVDDDEDEDEWDAFLGGESDQYTALELPVATAAVALIKCSRGTLNLALQACEAIGQQLDEEVNAGDSEEVSIVHSSLDQQRLNWMGCIHELARIVGLDMTDLGATLYPPLQLDVVTTAIDVQVTAIQAVLECVMDLNDLDDNTDKKDWQQHLQSSTVVELHSKLTSAVQNRHNEALEALSAATKQSAA